MIKPDWQAPPRVRALVTTRDFGDLKREAVRQKLRALLPADPAWLKQVHGNRVVQIPLSGTTEADAAIARTSAGVCVVQAADCMPVLFADEAGTTVAAAHAGWRGLAGGVLEATVDAMGVPPHKLLAWLGPAIGPRVYEVGDEVHAAFRGYAGCHSRRRGPGTGCSTCTQWRQRQARRPERRVAAAAFAPIRNASASSPIAAIAPPSAWRHSYGSPSVESNPP